MPFKVGQWVLVQDGDGESAVACIQAVAPCGRTRNDGKAVHIDLGELGVKCTQVYTVRLATVGEVLAAGH